MGNFSSSLNPGVALSRRSQVYAFALRVHFNEASQLRANVEDWNDAVRVRGDAPEVDAVENGALQGPPLTGAPLLPACARSYCRGSRSADRHRCGVHSLGHGVASVDTTFASVRARPQADVVTAHRYQCEPLLGRVPVQVDVAFGTLGSNHSARSTREVQDSSCAPWAREASDQAIAEPQRCAARAWAGGCMSTW